MQNKPFVVLVLRQAIRKSFEPFFKSSSESKEPSWIQLGKSKKKKKYILQTNLEEEKDQYIDITDGYAGSTKSLDDC